uniref:EGF-like domain-containing protein n=1 Tax=Mesocestoides corti TaxID=53468 RepID=A0A5K3F7Q2_MESCO
MCPILSKPQKTAIRSSREISLQIRLHTFGGVFGVPFHFAFRRLRLELRRMRVCPSLGNTLFVAYWLTAVRGNSNRMQTYPSLCPGVYSFAYLTRLVEYSLGDGDPGFPHHGLIFITLHRT